jgi:hypothetical protein
MRCLLLEKDLANDIRMSEETFHCKIVSRIVFFEKDGGIRVLLAIWLLSENLADLAENI